MKIRTLEELTTPDRRVLAFTPWGLSTIGLKPEQAAEFQQQVIAASDLAPNVTEGTRCSFERLRSLHSFGILCYEAFTVAEDLAWLVMEQAFRERFVEYYEGKVPFVNVVSGVEHTLSASSFDEVYRAVKRGGSHSGKRWKLRLRSTGELVGFQGNLVDLQKWARSEGLLHGQMNKTLEPIYRRMRNFVAHPSYHLSMPPDSARTIRDLAEIINQLWGHDTPGGRLYGSPVEREILAVAWTTQAAGLAYSLMRADQVEGLDAEPEEWTCVVIRGVREDEDMFQFDAQFERTCFPSELLWGPGTPRDAHAWCVRESPGKDSVRYRDRLFALRIDQGRVSLPRRPEVALAIPPERRA